jgi:predicted nucleic acid-binding protein
MFRGLEEQPEVTFYVPDLFYIECANILWKYVRRFGYSAEEAHRNLEALGALDLLCAPSADLLTPSLELGLDLGITAYDACYAALSRQVSAPLVTADRPLFEKLTGSSIEVCWLGDLPGRVSP